VPRARHLTRTAALRLAPALNPDAFVGAVQFYDAQEDDARMVAFLARTAAAHGAALATNVRMDGLAADHARAGGGRVTGVLAHDLLDGTDLLIRGRHVVLAAGAWTNGGRAGDGDRDGGNSSSGRPRAYTSWSPGTGSGWAPGCSPGPRRACCS
jgi:glycerol-3-phosphate dehydrogenase